MNRCLLVLLAVTCVVYLRYYWQFPDEVVLVQVPASAFSTDLLLEKQPVLVDTPSSDAHGLARRLLCHMYVWESSRGQPPMGAKPTVLSAAWTAVYSSRGDLDLRLVRPVHAHDAQPLGVDVRLHRGQVLLVPFRWAYMSRQTHTRHSFWDLAHTAALLLAPLHRPSAQMPR